MHSESGGVESKVSKVSSLKVVGALSEVRVFCFD